MPRIRCAFGRVWLMRVSSDFKKYRASYLVIYCREEVHKSYNQAKSHKHSIGLMKHCASAEPWDEVIAYLRKFCILRLLLLSLLFQRGNMHLGFSQQNSQLRQLCCFASLHLQYWAYSILHLQVIFISFLISHNQFHNYITLLPQHKTLPGSMGYTKRIVLCTRRNISPLQVDC